MIQRFGGLGHETIIMYAPVDQAVGSVAVAAAQAPRTQEEVIEASRARRTRLVGVMLDLVDEEGRFEDPNVGGVLKERAELDTSQWISAKQQLRDLEIADFEQAQDGARRTTAFTLSPSALRRAIRRSKFLPEARTSFLERLDVLDPPTAPSENGSAGNGFLLALEQAAATRKKTIDGEDEPEDQTEAVRKRELSKRKMHFDFRIGGEYFETPELSAKKFSTLPVETQIMLGIGMCKKLYPEGDALTQRKYLMGLVNRWRKDDNKLTFKEYQATIKKAQDNGEVVKPDKMLELTDLAIPHLMPAMESGQRRKFTRVFERVLEQQKAA